MSEKEIRNYVKKLKLPELRRELIERKVNISELTYKADLAKKLITVMISESEQNLFNTDLSPVRNTNERMSDETSELYSTVMPKGQQSESYIENQQEIRENNSDINEEDNGVSESDNIRQNNLGKEENIMKREIDILQREKYVRDKELELLRKELERITKDSAGSATSSNTNEDAHYRLNAGHIAELIPWFDPDKDNFAQCQF